MISEEQMKTYRKGQKEFHCIFVDLMQAYDMVSREEP